VFQKRMFKVISPIQKKEGGTYWMRVGTGFTNKDDSINIYLDAWPKNFQLQLRELDEEDLRRRDGSPRSSLGMTSLTLNGGLAPVAATTTDDTPF
jgi:hypothetical protein